MKVCFVQYNIGCSNLLSGIARVKFLYRHLAAPRKSLELQVFNRASRTYLPFPMYLSAVKIVHQVPTDCVYGRSRAYVMIITSTSAVHSLNESTASWVSVPQTGAPNSNIRVLECEAKIFPGRIRHMCIDSLVGMLYH